MATSKELREKRAVLSKKIRDFADLASKEGRALTAEENTEYQAVNDDFDKLTAQIKLVERAESIETEPAPAPEPERRQSPKPGREDFDGSRKSVGDDPQPKPVTAEERALAFQAWCLRQSPRGGEHFRPEHQAAAERCGINLKHEEFSFRLRDNYNEFRREARALSTFLDTAGGYTHPTETFVAQLERAMLWFGAVRQTATVIRTASGENMLWPTSNDTGNTGALISENATVSQQDVTFGAVTLQAYMYTSKMVLVPFTLIQDSAVNLASVLADMLGERLGRIGNTHFTTGTGAARPKGIVTAATTFSAAAAASIAWDDIFKLVHSVDLAYRNGPGAGFMLHDTICRDLRLLKDGNGRYLWVDSVQLGKPDTILGYPVHTNNDMASTSASGNKTVLFGQLSKYMIRDVGTIRIKRLVERYADSDQEAFLAFARFDGNLMDAGVAPVKVLTH